MTTRSRWWLPSFLLLVAAASVPLLLGSCSDTWAEPDPVADGKSGATEPAADTPLAAWQGELLDLALKSSSAIPVQPHIKDRSKAQEAVVDACLALDQPQRALAAIERIDNWRRGTGCADAAFHAAQHGRTAEAERLLGLARGVSEKAAGEDTEEDPSQGWRRDRIRAGIARTYLLLGQADKAAPFAADLADSEAGGVAAMQAQLLDAGAFEARVAELDAAVKDGGFDRIHNAQLACAQLYDRFYADEARRAALEGSMKASWKLPVLVGIGLMEGMAEAALAHEDRVRALALVEETRALVDGQTWMPEDAVPLQARLAGLRGRAGDADGARKQLDAALALFDAERARIANVFRAGALRPVAEAWQALGDTTAARAAYRRAVEAGTENPNSRPRAEDLSATCLSMAVHGVEPDAALTARLAAIAEALGPPW